MKPTIPYVKLKQVESQLAQNVTELRKNFTSKKVENIYNKSKNFSNQYGEIYNIMRYTEQMESSWFATGGRAVLTDQITIDGIVLTKLTSSNFYHEMKTGVTLPNLQDGKKYLCSAYVINFGLPVFFYMDNPTVAATNVTKATYADSKLRRFKFVIDGRKDIQWYVQGNSGYNKVGTGYSNELYVGGFQIEEIPTDTKNGVAAIGDSTVQVNNGTWDSMTGTSWTKFLGGLLGVEVYNRGIGGQTTQQMINRWATDMTPLASKCKYAIIQGGINDLATLTADQILANHQTMHDLAVTDGFIPVHLTITPCRQTGANETKRLDANTKIKATFTNVIDIASVVTDPVETNELVKIDKWYGDGTHYEIEARIAVANYIASAFTWDFREPKSYQRVKDTNIFDNSYLRTNSGFYDSTGTKRVEIKDFGTGIDLILAEGANTTRFRLYSTIASITNPSGDLELTPKTTTKLNEIVKIAKEIRLPVAAPAAVLSGQLWVDEATGTLKYTSGNTTKTVTGS